MLRRLPAGRIGGAVALFLLLPVVYAQTASYAAWQWKDHVLERNEAVILGSVGHPDAWLARDKAVHTGMSFLITLSSQYVLESNLELSEGDALPISVASAFSAGLFKEVLDSRRAVNPHFCYRDLVADAAGILLAVGLIAL